MPEKPEKPEMSPERIAEQAVMKKRIADIALEKLTLYNLAKTMRGSVSNRPTNRAYRGGAF